MSENKEHENLPDAEPKQQADTNADSEANFTAETAENSNSEKKEEESEISLAKQLAELNDKYLRLYSEFDNYRKRTIKEKSDIIKSAGEDVLKSILPVLDDFERAIKQNEKTEDIAIVKEGFALIHHKIKHIAQQKGLQEQSCIGMTFDADIMEAITHIPASEPSQKNTVIDEIEKCYKLGDKVIRFAKVVVAQ